MNRHFALLLFIALVQVGPTTGCTVVRRPLSIEFMPTARRAPVDQSPPDSEGDPDAQRGESGSTEIVGEPAEAAANGTTSEGGADADAGDAGDDGDDDDVGETDTDESDVESDGDDEGNADDDGDGADETDNDVDDGDGDDDAGTGLAG